MNTIALSSCFIILTTLATGFAHAQSCDGTFAPQTRYAAGSTLSSVSLGDLDGDGDLDMVVANPYTSKFSSGISVLLNNGDGTFAPQTRYEAGDEQSRRS